MRLGADRLHGRGVATGRRPRPYALTYELETAAGWVTSRLAVETHGEGWQRRLELLRVDAWQWTVDAEVDGEVDLPPPGGSVGDFAAALDCDLGLSPLTNTMPVLRHGLLHVDGTYEFVMACVSVPDLRVVASGQRYTTAGHEGGLRRVEYSTLQRDFVSILTFDSDGLVVGYPQLARRVPLIG